MKILFVNACMRGEKSRTLKLCKSYLETLKHLNPDAVFEEVDLDSLEIEAQNGEILAHRDELRHADKFDDEMFDLAKQLIAADHVVIGAPYWDLSFPAKLKVYLERCSVDKLTFAYDEHGVPHGNCKASSLTYITTAGGFIGDWNFGFDYVKGLTSALFGIPEFHFVSAEGLDIFGVDVDEKLDTVKGELAEIAKSVTAKKA